MKKKSLKKSKWRKKEEREQEIKVGRNKIRKKEPCYLTRLKNENGSKEEESEEQSRRKQKGEENVK